VALLTLYEHGIAPGPSLGLVHAFDVLHIGRCRYMGGGAHVARKPRVAVSVEQGLRGPLQSAQAQAARITAQCLIHIKLFGSLL
jgi:hypothetical protein